MSFAQPSNSVTRFRAWGRSLHLKVAAQFTRLVVTATGFTPTCLRLGPFLGGDHLAGVVIQRLGVAEERQPPVPTT